MGYDKGVRLCWAEHSSVRLVGKSGTKMRRLATGLATGTGTTGTIGTTASNGIWELEHALELDAASGSSSSEETGIVILAIGTSPVLDPMDLRRLKMPLPGSSKLGLQLPSAYASLTELTTGLANFTFYNNKLPVYILDGFGKFAMISKCRPPHPISPAPSPVRINVSF